MNKAFPRKELAPLGGHLMLVNIFVCSLSVLVIFYCIFNYFGLDWIAIVRIIPIIATMILITKCYKYFYKT